MSNKKPTGVANKMYQPLANDEAEHPLPVPTIANTEALMSLRLRSYVLETGNDRLELAREYGLTDLVVEGEIDQDADSITLKPADLSILEYVVEVVKLFFPKANLEDNERSINPNVVHEAVADFLALVRPPSAMSTSALSALLAGSLT